MLIDTHPSPISRAERVVRRFYASQELEKRLKEANKNNNITALPLREKQRSAGYVTAQPSQGLSTLPFIANTASEPSVVAGMLKQPAPGSPLGAQVGLPAEGTEGGGTVRQPLGSVAVTRGGEKNIAKKASITFYPGGRFISD